MGEKSLNSNQKLMNKSMILDNIKLKMVLEKYGLRKNLLGNQ